MVYGPLRTAAGSIAMSCLDVPGVFFCKRVEGHKNLDHTLLFQLRYRFLVMSQRLQKLAVVLA